MTTVAVEPSWRSSVSGSTPPRCRSTPGGWNCWPGTPGAAEAELRKDYESLDAIGERNYISTIAGLLAEALYRQGLFDEAGRFAAFCEEVAAPSDGISQSLWRGVRGKLLARDGAYDEGIELAASGVREMQSSDDIEGQANALVFLAEAQGAAGQFELAAESASRARRLFEAKGNVISAGRVDELVSFLGPTPSESVATSA